jgi:hypothetical protein
MTDSPAPILDYAGPASRRRLRLPAKSNLDVTHNDRELHVIETLSGKAGAVFALMFALLPIATTGAMIHDLLVKFPRDLGILTLGGLLEITQIVLMFAVIDSTWRRTVLRVTRSELSLAFSSPLRGTTRHQWPAEKVRSATVSTTAMGVDAIPVHQLELDIWGGPAVHLFAGHDYSDLSDFAAAINALQPPSSPPA